MKRLGHGQSTLAGVFDVKLNLRFDMKCVLPAAVRLVRVVWNGKLCEGCEGFLLL